MSRYPAIENFGDLIDVVYGNNEEENDLVE